MAKESVECSASAWWDSTDKSNSILLGGRLVAAQPLLDERSLGLVVDEINALECPMQSPQSSKRWLQES